MALSVSVAQRTASEALSGDDWLIESASTVYTRKSGGGSMFSTPVFSHSNAFNTGLGAYPMTWSGGTPTASGSVKGGRYFYGNGGGGDLGCYVDVTIPGGQSKVIKVYTSRGDSTSGSFRCTAYYRPGGDTDTQFATVTFTGDATFTIAASPSATSTLRIVLNGLDGGYNVANSWALASAGGASYSLAAAAGALSLAGVSAGIKVSRRMVGDAAAMTVAGQAAALRRGRTLQAGAGGFSLAAGAAGIRRALVIAAGGGAYALTGQPAAMRAGKSLVAAAGAYALSGVPTGLRRSLRLAAGAGGFTVVGQPAGLSTTSGKKIVAAPGAFAINGGAAALRRAARLSAQAGSFTAAGGAAAMHRGRRMTAGNGVFAAAGGSAGLRVSRLLRGETAAFDSVGRSAELTYSGAGPVQTSAHWTYTIPPASLAFTVQGNNLAFRISRAT